MAMTGRRVLTLCLVIALVFLALSPETARAFHIKPDGSTTTVQQEQEGETGKQKEKKKEKEKEKEGGEEGTLGTFESEATDERPDTLQSGESGEASGWWGFFGEVALYAFVGGTIGSWYRVTGSPADSDLEQYFGERQTGDPGIPYIGLILSYQNVESDVEALDVNVEGGYGPIGARYRFTRFREEDPDTDLDLTWFHGVLRLSYTRYVEVGLGLGAIFLDGTSSESGGSFTLPIRIEPSRHFGFDYQPTWGWINGNTISDHDLALRLGIRYVSIRGGYRWTKSGNSTLKGPIIGLLLSY